MRQSEPDSPPVAQRSILRLPGWRTARYGAALAASSLGLLFAWPGLAGNLLESGYGGMYFMPHGHCYMWVPQLWLLHGGTVTAHSEGRGATFVVLLPLPGGGAHARGKRR